MRSDAVIAMNLSEPHLKRFIAVWAKGEMTMRLIDAGKLEQALVEERNNIPLTVPCAPYELMNCKLSRAGQFQRSGIRKALRVLSEQPAVDAVPVVRCRDCKHYLQNPWNEEEELLCKLWVNWSLTEPNDFCSHGERRSGDE